MDSGMVGEFESEEALLAALQKLRDLGYRRLDAFTPHPVHGLDELLHLPRSPLPFILFPIALGGAGFAFFVQWYCNVYSYNLNVGGRPSFAVPAFVPITFETMVLASGISALVVLFYLLGLPRLSHPVFDVEGFERASVDRFFAAVDLHDPQFESQRTRQVLMEVGALRCAPFGAARPLGEAP